MRLSKHAPGTEFYRRYVLSAVIQEMSSTRGKAPRRSDNTTANSGKVRLDGPRR